MNRKSTTLIFVIRPKIPQRLGVQWSMYDVECTMFDSHLCIAVSQLTLIKQSPSLIPRGFSC